MSFKSSTISKGFSYGVPSNPELQEISQPVPRRPGKIKIRPHNAIVSESMSSTNTTSTKANIPIIQIPDHDMAAHDDNAGFRADRPATPHTPQPVTTPGAYNGIGAGYGIARPLSAMSFASDSTEASFFSDDQSSVPSDFNSMSPVSDSCDDIFVGDKSMALSVNYTAGGRSRKSDLSWTKQETAHLWAVYIHWCQDPKVTPCRIGRNSVPPEGICHRIARAARKEWVQPASKRLLSVHQMPLHGDWKHSGPATRRKLRELCRAQQVSSRVPHMQSREATPSSRETSPTPFGTDELAQSLTMSTAQSMQPDDFLAKLAYSHSTLAQSRATRPTMEEISIFTDHNPAYTRFNPDAPNPNRPKPKLSPAAKPGPSHSRSKTLGSPVQMDGNRTLTGSVKRRAQDALAEDGAGSARPSILDGEMFGAPSQGSTRRVRSRSNATAEEAFNRTSTQLQSALDIQTETDNEYDEPPRIPPRSASRRLGSPFTFPRAIPDGTQTVHRSGYATMNHSKREPTNQVNKMLGLQEIINRCRNHQHDRDREEAKRRLGL